MCARLTILCGRRGGEHARLLLPDSVQVKNGEWLDQQRMKYLENIELLLVKSMKIAYMTGKWNNHLVPVLIPRDTVPAIQRIADPKFRRKAGVSPTNNFLFAMCRDQEDGHLLGWHAVHEICTSLQL